MKNRILKANTVYMLKIMLHEEIKGYVADWKSRVYVVDDNFTVIDILSHDEWMGKTSYVNEGIMLDCELVYKVMTSIHNYKNAEYDIHTALGVMESKGYVIKGVDTRRFIKFADKRAFVITQDFKVHHTFPAYWFDCFLADDWNEPFNIIISTGVNDKIDKLIKSYLELEVIG